MAWFVVLGIGIGIGIGSIARFRIHGRRRKDLDKDGVGVGAVGELKNALLALALGRLCADDLVDGLEVSQPYAAYDGSKLPPMSGFDIRDACMTYIVDVPSGSLLADQKTRAVERYLRSNLGKREQACDFFDHFVQDYTGRFQQLPDERLVKST